MDFIMSPDPSECRPLSLTRSIGSFPIANWPLADHQARALAGTGLAAHPHAWLDPAELAAFAASGTPALVDTQGVALAWRGDSPGPGPQPGFAASASFLIRYPWDLLRANEQAVGALSESRIEGEVHASAVIEGVLHLAAGSRVLPGVFIEGKVIIGSGCKIGPNCYIRGTTSIADHCHIGQSVEIKNCLVLSHTNVGHLSYVGDSVLGERVNFGAGTTASNLRHDGRTHRAWVNGGLVDTGRRKFGCVAGDGVHTGIHTSIYPGRMLWPATTTRPGEIVARNIESA